MSRIIDLHTHTNYSDGVLTPAELVKKAKEVGLGAIGIADHDQVAGIGEALAAGEKYGVEVVPSVELSTYWTEKGRREFHILGYYIDWESRTVINRLAVLKEERERRAEASLVAFEQMGYVADRKYLKKIARGAIGRPHLADTIINNPKNKRLLEENLGKGYDWRVFFKAYLDQGKPAYREKAGFEPKEAIDFIHQNGGVAVLAHPGWDVVIGEENVLKQLRSWGIDGLEVLAWTESLDRSRKCIKYFGQYAKQHGLLITGGSDFHGTGNSGVDLGLVNEGIEVGYGYLEKLKEQ